jgi:transposase InsO family protein
LNWKTSYFGSNEEAIGRQKHTGEHIISKLREAEVLQAKQMFPEEISRQLGTIDATFYEWHKEYGGLRVDQAKRLTEWLNDGSCIRLRPERTNHVWSYDFVSDRTSDGRPMRMLIIIDEYSRECLKIRIDRQLKAADVIDELSELFIERGVPDHLRSDNGSEFTAALIRGWLQRLGVKTLFIEPGSPWENGYIESFDGKLRDELLNGEIFATILEARVITERWREQYNTIRPHSSLAYRPPAPEAYFPGQVRLTNTNRPSDPTKLIPSP